MPPPFGTWPSNSPPSWRATLWLPKTESYGATLLHYTKTAIRGLRVVGKIGRSRQVPSLLLHHQLRRHLRWHRRTRGWLLTRGNECKIITIFTITIIRWDVRVTRITPGHLVVRKMRWLIICRDGCIDFGFWIFCSFFFFWQLLTDWIYWIDICGFWFSLGDCFYYLMFRMFYDTKSVCCLSMELIVWLGSDISFSFLDTFSYLLITIHTSILAFLGTWYTAFTKCIRQDPGSMDSKGAFRFMDGWMQTSPSHPIRRWAQTHHQLFADHSTSASKSSKIHTPLWA